MAAYITPDMADASLLVPIPRLLNRTQYQIDEYDLPFVGHDVWHGYEVSFLNKIGMPVNLRLEDGISVLQSIHRRVEIVKAIPELFQHAQVRIARS